MGVIARYRDYLPIGPSTPEVDLQEGSTPLVPSRNIGRALGLSRLFFKYEGLNPTGSFKDRGMVVAVARALEAGSRVLVCASTGNTSASMAAYAARTGVRAIVVVPSGEIAMNKLSQALMYGAQAEGAAPIVTGHPIANPRTVASAIRIGNPASWEGATSARDESGGLIAAVTDTEILAAQIRLANTEGLFAEPASAAPLALLFRLVMEGKIEKDSTTVVVLTGSGLKDPDAALKNVEPPIELDGDARTLAKVLKL